MGEAVTTAAIAGVTGKKGKSAREAGKGILDPADIFGGRRKKERKESKARAKKAKKKRKKQLEDLFEKHAPKDIAKAERVGAITISDKLAASQALGRGDVGFLRDIAQAKGPTAAAERLTERQRLEEQTGLETLQEEQSRRGAEAFESLAGRGGAGAGARERLLAQTGAGGLREAQRARRAGAEQRLGISSEDELRKLQVAQALPGQQIALTAEQRAGLTSDQQANLAAQQANQAASLRENLANLGIQQQQFGTRAGLLGGSQLAAQQRATAQQQEKIGPLGSGGGFLGLPTSGVTPTNLFGR